MKRVLSIIMIAAMAITGTMSVCFADGEDTADGNVDVKAVVSDALQKVDEGNVAFDISESITLKAETNSTEAQVSSLVIHNRTEGQDLVMTNLSSEGKNGWDVVTENDITGADIDAKYIALFLGEESLNEEIDVDDGIITDGATRSFLLDGMIAKQSTPMSLSSVATLVATVAINTEA